MFAATLGRVRDFVFRPKVRLEPKFPFSWGKFASASLIALLWFMLGTVVIPAGIAIGLTVIAAASPDASAVIQPFMTNPDGTPTTQFATWMMVLSFFGGFGLATLSIGRGFRRAGTSLSEVMALNFKAIAGSNPLVTALGAIGRVLGTYGLWIIIAIVLSQFVPPGHQDTVEFAQKLSGWDLLRFALMAAVAAPIFEEIVFRGFLFQGLRSNLRKGALSNRVGLADFAAVIISSAIFSLAHMQFNPTTMLMLFLLGCLHAELYRRTGSLYCSMMLHAVNNGLQVLLLVFAMQ